MSSEVGLGVTVTPAAGAPAGSGRRIAHVTDFYLPRLGGIERHVADLAKAQREAGDLVDVISVRGLVGAEDTSSKPTSALAGWLPRARRSAERAALAGAYDVVHAHVSLATPLSFSVAAAASQAGIPTVVTMHSMIDGPAGTLFATAAGAARWRQWPIEWTAVSAPAAAQLDLVLHGERRVGVLSNAVDIPRWSACHPRAHESVHVIAVMRLAQRKRPLPFLRMLENLRSSVPQDLRLRATIVGEGPARRSMERFIRRRGLSDWVELRGRVGHSEILDLFADADIFVAPAERESFGLAALEARTAGLPVVAMRGSGIAEFVQHGTSGLLAADDAEMVRAIAALATSEAVRETIRGHNRLNPPGFDWVNALWAADDVYARAARLQPGAGHPTARRRDQVISA